VTRYSLTALLMAVGLLTTAHAVTAADPPEASVVFIDVGYMDNNAFVKVEEGAGFLVHPAGWVVTARHITEAPVPNGKTRVFHGAPHSRYAPPIQLFPVVSALVGSDIALLRFPANLRSNWSYLKVTVTHAFSNGDRVTAFGYPDGNDITVRPGVVSALEGPSGSVGVNVGLAPGMSGGPVILSDTQAVVGVVAGGSGNPGFDYFTPLQLAKPLLDVPPAQYVTEARAAPSETPPAPILPPIQPPPTVPKRSSSLPCNTQQVLDWLHQHGAFSSQPFDASIYDDQVNWTVNGNLVRKTRADVAQDEVQDRKIFDQQYSVISASATMVGGQCLLTQELNSYRKRRSTGIEDRRTLKAIFYIRIDANGPHIVAQQVNVPAG